MLPFSVESPLQPLHTILYSTNISVLRNVSKEGKVRVLARVLNASEQQLVALLRPGVQESDAFYKNNKHNYIDWCEWQPKKFAAGIWKSCKLSQKHLFLGLISLSLLWLSWVLRSIIVNQVKNSVTTAYFKRTWILLYIYITNQE